MPRGGVRVGAGRPKKGDGCRERQRQKRAMMKKEPASKECAYCGEIYVSARRKFCSVDCCVRSNYKSLTSYKHTCPTCGDDFKGKKKQKYCSYDCNQRRNQRVSMGGEIERRCVSCGEWKSSTKDHYGNDKSRYNGFAPVCKPCSIKKAVARSKTERGKELRKASNIRNIETRRAYAKNIQPIMNEREKIRSRTDPPFQLNRRMRCLMWAGLKKAKGGRSWQELTGYSLDTLRHHIENRFKDGMTWGRFLAGEIHIDHIIPRAAFNFIHPEDPDFKKCWSLKNLQPLWATDNLIKSDKLVKPFQPSLTIGG